MRGDANYRLSHTSTALYPSAPTALVDSEHVLQYSTRPTISTIFNIKNPQFIATAETPAVKSKCCSGCVKSSWGCLTCCSREIEKTHAQLNTAAEQAEKDITNRLAKETKENIRKSSLGAHGELGISVTHTSIARQLTYIVCVCVCVCVCATGSYK